MTTVAPGMHSGGIADLELKRRGTCSTLQTRMQQAVCVRRAQKRYGSKKDPFIVLDGLSMTVPKGSIYGLLGASGCGKTTLLNCIVGRKRLNSGEIWVLGGKPGSRGSGVPGPRLGYMPQEIALYGEFTIRETLSYFGRIVGLSKEKIETRTEFLINLLLLPNADKFINILSGGQQRRVSLSAALIHEPELLILDEPTVGVDPLLRQNIWDYLVDITKGGNTTVIITTHYIDETRQATKIGLMRGGYFLAEEPPAKLLSYFACETLEDVFLKLSVMQNMSRRRRSSIAQATTDAISFPSGIVNQGAVIDEPDLQEISGEFGDNVSIRSARRVSISPAPVDEEALASLQKLPPSEEPPSKLSDYCHFFNLTHMSALIWKDCLWLWRNFSMLILILGLPISQTLLFCYAIGHDPRVLKIAVVNHELEENEICKKNITCMSDRLGCDYLSYVNKDDAIMFTYYDSEEEARHLVQRGKAYASIVIPHNYSDALRERIAAWRKVKDEDLLASTVDIFRDLSNKHIATYLMLYFYDTFQSFLQDYTESCGFSRKVLNFPIAMNKPIYGKARPNFTDFAAPGVIITIVFFLSVALTAVIMMNERNEGILERSLVIGITSTEILFAHATVLFLVMLVQSLLVLVCAFPIFGITQDGPMILVILLTLLAGMGGMCFGFVISCAFETERTATYASMGALLPMITLCGIIWPVEAMQVVLRTTAFILPLTKPTESLRAVMAKGWDLTYESVYLGFITQLIWVVIFLTISILILKFKKG